MALDRENRPDMILSKLSANYLGAISNIHKIFFNTIPAPWVLILKGGIWLLFGHLLEVLLKSKIISIQIFYGRIFLSFLNEWILYSSDSKHHIWPCHCLRHHWIRLQKIFLRFLIWSSALQAAGSWTALGSISFWLLMLFWFELFSGIRARSEIS